jgi:uncharacterized Zn-binding protein involved in type VI secretion
MSVDIKALSAAVSQTVDTAIAPVKAIASEAVAVAEGEAPLPSNPLRAIQEVQGAVAGLMSMPMDLINTGFAAMTNAISAVLPSFPAAHLGSLYVGAPHAHLHPPSLVPPAPPVPLPTLGAITLGTCMKVLIGGMPAARVGDLGMAPTCVGFAPFFTVLLGSSKVFIGGARAARSTDMCTDCTPSTTTAISKMAVAISTLGMAADLVDLAMETDAAMQGAKALGVQTAAAQMAADAVASALSATMGTDPAVPPALPGFVTVGMPRVVIAGIPTPALPDPAQWVKNKLKKSLAKKLKARKDKKAEAGGKTGCAG